MHPLPDKLTGLYKNDSTRYVSHSFTTTRQDKKQDVCIILYQESIEATYASYAMHSYICLLLFVYIKISRRDNRQPMSKVEIGC